MISNKFYSLINIRFITELPIFRLSTIVSYKIRANHNAKVPKIWPRIHPAKSVQNYLKFQVDLTQIVQKHTLKNEWKREVEYFQNFISEIFEISMAEILCTFIYIYSGFFVISLNWYCYCPANQNYGFVDLSDFEFFCCKISKNLGSC